MGKAVDVSSDDVTDKSPAIMTNLCFRTVDSETSGDSDMDGIATAFHRRFHISVDESEQNNVSVYRAPFTFFSLFSSVEFLKALPVRKVNLNNSWIISKFPQNLHFSPRRFFIRFYLHARDLFYLVDFVKDLDDFTGSIDASSTDEAETTHSSKTEVAVSGEMLRATTLDDVDDDEAFISDLMAMHPNDEDIEIVDLESDVDLRTIQEALMTTEDIIDIPEPPPDVDEDGVRKFADVVSPIALWFLPLVVCSFPPFFCTRNLVI